MLLESRKGVIAILRDFGIIKSFMVNGEILFIQCWGEIGFRFIQVILLLMSVPSDKRRLNLFGVCIISI